jgi:hypothetical protein
MQFDQCQHTESFRALDMINDDISIDFRGTLRVIRFDEQAHSSQP